MSNTKHTPGPWSFNKNISGSMNFFGEDGSRIIMSEIRLMNEGANARLIAAAPDLLEALEAFKAIDAFDGWHPKYRDAIAKAEAAIAKATAQ